MIDQLLTWSLQSSGLLIVVYTAYYFLFRNNTSFQLRRGLILVTLILCILAPALKIEVKQDHPAFIQQVAESKPVLVKPIVDTPDFVQSDNVTSPVESINQTIPWFTYGTWVYYAGIVISLLFFLIELARIFYWKITGQKDTAFHPNVIRHYHVKAPFSFGRYIFLPQQPEYSEEVWAIIHQHESTHTQQRHTLDLVFARLLQAIFWYNPIIYLIQKELTVIHEALADRAVLKTTSIKQYAEALMQVSLAENHQSLGHSFALLSTLSKRLKMMKTHRTKLRATILSLIVLSSLNIGIIGWNSLKGQERRSSLTREEAFEQAKIRFKSLLPLLASNKLSEKHQRIFNILTEENPDDTLRFRYFKDAEFKPYYDDFVPDQDPLYIAKLSKQDKMDLQKEYMVDSTRIKIAGVYKIEGEKFSFRYSDFDEQVEEAISNNANYLMIYKYSYNPTEYDNSFIYEANEVEVLPKVVGGISNLAKTIALDISVPDHLNKNKLPETVDFSFVVQGGKSITHLNLLTELKGNKKKTEPYYRFFKTVHDHLRGKVATLYPWKRGVKDGEEVRVRMKISIPTKYMQ